MSRGRYATPAKLANKERQVMRTRIALWDHEGHSNTVIARELGVSVQTVCLWRQRIARQGAGAR